MLANDSSTLDEDTVADYVNLINDLKSFGFFFEDMAVIIGVGKYAFRRNDGVYVIPIGCLKD